MKERKDDFQTRRKPLEKMNDEALKAYFFKLSQDIVEPLVDMGRQYTSKSIERSVLLRMGFSSLECKDIVDTLYEHHLLSKGAGHCVYRLAKDKNISIREAGLGVSNTQNISYLRKVFDVHEES